MSKSNILIDSWIMFKRCMLISSRNPDTIAMSIITPIFVMLLFGGVFGNIADIEGFNYVDFIVPGIILQSVAQGSQFTALNLSTDMTKGIIDRFRSMPIAKSAVLLGHASAAIVRNIVTTSVTIGAAFLIGFRPQGSFIDWLVIALVLILCISAISWIAVLCGLLSKTAEGAGGLMFPLFILPFVSSGFAPTETMNRWLGWFANHQPMTPVIDSVRGLMLGFPLGNEVWLALAWCVGIAIGAFVLAVRIYKNKLTQ